MEIKLADFEKSAQELARRFKKVGVDFSQAAKGAVNACSYAIQEGGIKRAPKDEGDLEGSIEVVPAKKKANGEIEGHVHIPPNSPASSYAMHMHEGEYNLGPVSMQKNDTQPERVGNKYLLRAITEDLKKLQVLMRVKLMEALR